MLLQGILLGVSLSFMVGPLLFAIVEAGIGQGFRAGVSVAAGIWASDVLYMLAAMFGLDAMETLVSFPNFKVFAGTMGGLLLAGFGFGSLWKVRKAVPVSEGFNLPESPVKSPKNYVWWWLRGFLVNTVNPGTVFFWLGIVSAVVVPSGWGKDDILVFFGGMLSTLVVTDTLKAWAAKRLRKFLTAQHTQRIQQGLGIVLLVFGVVLILRTVFF